MAHQRSIRIAQAELDNGDIVRVQIKQRGTRNSRAVLPNGEELLIPNEKLRDETEQTVSVEGTAARIIPISPLRHLYRLLRQIPAGTMHKDIFSLLASDQGTRVIRDLFDRSVDYFGTYDNRREPFVSKKSDRKADLHNVFAKNLVTTLKTGNPAAFDGNDQAISLVDYEVSPWRTTNSKFEDGSTARKSGQGGIDLLLCWSGTGVPIIGEVKARTESVGPFFALLQALMYASELVTESQWTRLQMHWADKLPSPSKLTPGLDIMLIFEISPEGEEEYELVKALTSKLIHEKGTLVQERIRRILMVTAMIEEKRVVFKTIA